MRGVELHDSCFLNFITYRELTGREVFSKAAAFRLVLQRAASCTGTII